MRRTKILATLGPASSSEETLVALLGAGVDAVRLNFSHGTRKEHEAEVERVRRVARAAQRSVPIVQDIQGPKIRVGDLAAPISLAKGAEVTLVVGDRAGAGEVPVTYPHLAEDVKPGDPILMDDGYIALAVLATDGRARVRCRVEAGGTLKSHKGVNFPGVRLSIRFPTEKDKIDLRLGQELGVEYVAASFIRSASDLSRVRAELDDEVGTRLIAKVELREAIDNLDEIVRAADAVMIARGDLGVELAPELVPLWQKRILVLCDRLGVPVITATQMLESMIEHPRPTRAEATDVYNSVLDGTGAVMLSGETAVGAWPVDAVRTMARICEVAEEQLFSDVDIKTRWRAVAREGDVGDAVAHAACRAAEDTDAKAILALTNTGHTARLVSKYKPKTPILALTPSERTLAQLKLLWGVTSLLLPPIARGDDRIAAVEKVVLESSALAKGDRAVLVSGRPGETGSTSIMRVIEIGKAK
ncbi:MAG: pyruvate kinase [Thermoplasmatota archaeon]